MSEYSNVFVVRGKLAGPPQVETITTKSGKSFNKTTFVLDVEEERKGNNGPYTATATLKCQATEYSVSPQVLSNIPVGSTVLATGKLNGRKNEYNGKVSYFTDLEVSNVAYGGDNEIPF